MWNKGTDEDGRHQAVNMKNYADITTGNPTDAPIASGMDVVGYVRTIGSEKVPMSRNIVGITQLLGIRAYAVFNNVSGNVSQTLVSSYNVTSIIRQVTGRFSINYTSSVGTDNYMMLGVAISSVGIDTPCTFSASGTNLGNKNTLQGIFLAYSGTGTANDNILQGWVVVFGGYA